MNREKGIKIDKINEYDAKCSRCKEIQPITQFQWGRKGKVDEYQFSYCNTCRRSQINNNFNNHLDRYLKERFRKLKKRANKLDINFELSFDDFLKQYTNQGGKCFYSGKEMKCKTGLGHDGESLSVDKIIPSLGYIKGNFVFCTNKINTAKCDLDIEEMKLWTPYWYDKIIDKFKIEGNLKFGDSK